MRLLLQDTQKIAAHNIHTKHPHTKTGTISHMGEGCREGGTPLPCYVNQKQETIKLRSRWQDNDSKKIRFNHLKHPNGIAKSLTSHICGEDCRDMDTPSRAMNLKQRP